MDKALSTHAPPADILAQIFETVIEDYENPRVISVGTTTVHEKFKQATRLSSVSRAWRFAALDTPWLWNSISISLHWEFVGLLEYWTRTMNRVKGVPVYLLIYSICSASRVQLEKLDGSTMRIRQMSLHFRHPGDVELYPESWRGYDIGTLKVAIDRQYAGRQGPHPPDETLKCSGFFGTAHTFDIRSEKRSPIDFPSGTIMHLLHLSLYKVLRLDTAHVFRLFPRLQNLQIAQSSFLLPLAEVEYAAELRALELQDNGDSEWMLKMRFSKLRELTFNDCTFSEFGSFLDAHPTLEMIAIKMYWDHDLGTIAMHAGQVTTLHLLLNFSLPWADALIAPGAFPVLKKLGIFEWNGQITPRMLDAVIKARCLPLGHPQSTTNKSTDIVEEFFVQVMSQNDCGESELYNQADKRITQELYRRRIYLTWPVK